MNEIKQITKPTTKIIAGAYKGKVLSLPSLDVTRSSKAVLKESVFNVLQFDIIDKIFIESFAGSGSIGLEAISRGAKRAYFIELDKKSYSILVKNCKSINIEKCQTIQGNAFVQTPLILEFLKNSNETFDLIFIDADKENYPEYLQLVKPRMKSGSVLMIDNVLWYGKVLDEKGNKQTEQIKLVNKLVAEDADFENVILPLRDGIHLVRKK